jgi:hypothetical protein
MNAPGAEGFRVLHDEQQPGTTAANADSGTMENIRRTVGKISGESKMKKKPYIPVLAILTLGLPLFYAVNRASASSEQKQTSGDSVQNLKDRIGKLEVQVAVLQAQLKELASKSSQRILTLPGNQVFRGNKIPPGASEHEINGIKYWTIPLKDGK